MPELLAAAKRRRTVRPAKAVTSTLMSCTDRKFVNGSVTNRFCKTPGTLPAGLSGRVSRVAALGLTRSTRTCWLGALVRKSSCAVTVVLLKPKKLALLSMYSVNETTTRLAPVGMKMS